MLCFAYSKPEENTIAFNSQNTRWKHKLIPKNGKVFKWTFKNDTPDLDGMNLEKRLVNYALQEYSWRFNISFEYTTDISLADIIIEYKNQESDSFLTSGVLAYAGFPRTQYQGKIVINDSHLFSKFGEGINAHEKDPINYPDPNTKTKFLTYKLVQIFKHEIGHILGLVHNENDSHSVLYPFYDKKKVMLKKDDIIDLSIKYGKKPNLNERILLRKLAYIEYKLLLEQKII